jgi:hypothetical protein
MAQVLEGWPHPCQKVLYTNMLVLIWGGPWPPRLPLEPPLDFITWFLSLVLWLGHHRTCVGTKPRNLDHLAHTLEANSVQRSYCKLTILY